MWYLLLLSGVTDCPESDTERELLWKIIHFKEIWTQLSDCGSGELIYNL